MGSNCGYHMVRGKSNLNDFTLAAKACLPIIVSILADIENNTYPQNCFLNITVPTDVQNHKGYKMTRQGKSIIKTGWKQTTNEGHGAKMLSTMTMDFTPSQTTQPSVDCTGQDHFLFAREVRAKQMDNECGDYSFLQEGYITVTPINALFTVDVESSTLFKDWLP
ncbi:unnamed protein product [Cuscuta europaea]|uniref:Uncharacterized protein n=1 Tax=Cuscuta europaea TaxID=41803 RepID=A0A9P0ZGK5_CUSEU|nr:unnamed protein product [Cuscuta europaea]